MQPFDQKPFASTDVDTNRVIDDPRNADFRVGGSDEHGVRLRLLVVSHLLGQSHHQIQRPDTLV